MADSRSITTKDVALLSQLRQDDQLRLAPEFQRAGVWPRPAKAFLVDTILANRPIPLLFFARTVNAQTGRSTYDVIDGQQRLRAIFDFIDGKFSLTESPVDSPWFGQRWKDLSEESRTAIYTYDFVVQELSGYADSDVRDMFRRMNRYVVPLNSQEQRHAVMSGYFKDFVEEVGKWPFWAQNRIFSAAAQRRRNSDEFAAELAVLLIEGPQDKKGSLDLYFEAYREDNTVLPAIRSRLEAYVDFLAAVLPNLRTMQLRRRANIYALIGALDEVSAQSEELNALNKEAIRRELEAFDRDIQAEEPPRGALAYVRAASRQTDNITPRQTRIRVLKNVLARGL